ncbi:RNA 3'-terminal phosphate cyclase [Acidobacteria bacterium AH-259-L09]|nr:RNA 3'-terminal phosphate cyclase [Acidobacteria bacterium AH-259-L09]
MIEIDGSHGEGGGQVLRSSLALSLITGTPVRIVNIRARRSKSGLMAQHLKAVEAAVAVGKARVEGAQLGSLSLVFEPRRIQSGELFLEIGTAGSTSLVLQTVLLPLGFAGGGSSIIVSGGTHTPWSPCFHYLDLQWLRCMQKIGFDIQLKLERAGFYPEGGGRVHARVRTAARLSPLLLTERGALLRILGISSVSNLDIGVAERQKKQALYRLRNQNWNVEIEVVRLPSSFKGTMLLLIAEFESSQCCYYSLGARGKTAELVADETVDQLEEFLARDGAIDQYLADQLILPLAVVSGVSELRTSRVTQHLLTNAEIVRMFLPVRIEVAGELGQTGLIRIERTVSSQVSP